LVGCSRRGLIVLIPVLLVLAACTREHQQVTVTLNNGDTWSGTLEARDAGTVTVLTPAGEAKTFLARQIQSVEEQKKSAAKTAASSAPPPSAAPTLDPTPPATPFVPPASGRITIPAGTGLTLRLKEVLDGSGDSSNFGNFVTTVVIDDIKAGETSIPADSPLNIMAVNKPGTGGREMTCSLSVVFLGNRPWAPEGGSRFGGKDPVLGSISAPPKENLPPAARDLPLRLPVHSVIHFKLTAPISLRESK
jgi:small nuclear ribonucleoprotein (snRNP)-like protein